MHDARAAGIGQELVTVSDQRPGGDGKLDSHPSFPVVDQVDHLSLSKGEFFRDHSQKALFAIDPQLLDGLELPVALVTVDDFGPAHTEFVAFPPHGLDKDSQLKLPPALNQNILPLFAFFHLDGHITPRLLYQALTDTAHLHVFSVLPSQRRVVDGELHGHRGFVHGDSGQGSGELPRC